MEKSGAKMKKSYTGLEAVKNRLGDEMRAGKRLKRVYTADELDFMEDSAIKNGDKKIIDEYIATWKTYVTSITTVSSLLLRATKDLIIFYSTVNDLFAYYNFKKRSEMIKIMTPNQYERFKNKKNSSKDDPPYPAVLQDPQIWLVNRYGDYENMLDEDPLEILSENLGVGDMFNNDSQVKKLNRHTRQAILAFYMAYGIREGMRVLGKKMGLRLSELLDDIFKDAELHIEKYNFIMKRSFPKLNEDLTDDKYDYPYIDILTEGKLINIKSYENTKEAKKMKKYARDTALADIDADTFRHYFDDMMEAESYK